MSGGLVPSKSTVYISNLPFGLKNNDLYQVFTKYGKIVKITILKEKISRKSKGVAFILFLKKEAAEVCIECVNEKEMFGRVLKASIAKDNGRSAEFIRRKEYPDKSKCYECGEEGHLSYICRKNLLGDREPPAKKSRKRKKKPRQLTEEEKEYFNTTEEEEEVVEGNDDETLSAAIAMEQEKIANEEYRYKVATGSYTDEEKKVELKRLIKRSKYFSDEEDDSSD